MVSLVQFLKRNAFRKEMAAVIVLKIAAIFVLWGLFFSHADRTRLDKGNVVKHFVE